MCSCDAIVLLIPPIGFSPQGLKIKEDGWVYWGWILACLPRVFGVDQFLDVQGSVFEPVIFFRLD